MHCCGAGGGGNDLLLSEWHPYISTWALRGGGGQQPHVSLACSVELLSMSWGTGDQADPPSQVGPPSQEVGLRESREPLPLSHAFPELSLSSRYLEARWEMQPCSWKLWERESCGQPGVGFLPMSWWGKGESGPWFKYHRHSPFLLIVTDFSCVSVSLFAVCS